MKGFFHKDVKLVNIDEQEFNRIPKNVEKFFPNIEALFVQNSMLEKVSKDDFKRYSKLKYLSLFGNMLSSVEGDLFDYTPNLVYINLSWNSLKHIGVNIFKNLPYLKSVAIYRNDCISTEIWNASKQQIEHFEEELLRRCPPNTDELDERSGGTGN